MSSSLKKNVNLVKLILTLFAVLSIANAEKLDSNNDQQLRILHWNIDKSGYGGDSPLEKGHLVLNEVLLPFIKENNINIISLNESANDCKNRGNYINYAKSLAEILDFNYLFKSDIINGPDSDGHQCNDGNGLLYSKSLNVLKSQSIVFTNQCCWSENRNFLVISVKLDGKNVTIISTHLEAGKSVSDFLLASVTRDKQAEEIVNLCHSENNYDCVVMGDMNFPFKSLPFNIKPFSTFKDSMKDFSIFERNTCPWSSTGKYGFGGLDYVLSQKNDHFEKTKIMGKDTPFYGLSDHHAVFTIYNLNKAILKSTNNEMTTSSELNNNLK